MSTAVCVRDKVSTAVCLDVKHEVPFKPLPTSEVMLIIIQIHLRTSSTNFLISQPTKLYIISKGRVLVESFLVKLTLLLKGTATAAPEKFGETLSDEQQRGGG